MLASELFISIRSDSSMGYRGSRCVGLLAVITALLIGNVAECSEPIPSQQTKAPAKAMVDGTDPTTVHGVRRRGRRNDNAVGSENRQSQRRRAGRAGRQGKQQASATTEEGNRLQLSGFFDLVLSDDIKAHGDGHINVEIDHATMTQVRGIVDDQVDRLQPLTADILNSVASFPETIKSVGEILERLSDPDTQKSLRQVEQLLRLIQQSPVGSGVGP